MTGLQTMLFSARTLLGKDATFSEFYDASAFACLYLAKTASVAQHIGDRSTFPYMYVVMAPLIASALVPGAIKRIKGHVPWEKVAVFLNTLGGLGVIDANSRDPYFLSILSSIGGLLPEDFTIRSLVWSSSDLLTDFFDGRIVDEDERTLKMPSHPIPRTERWLWLRCFLRHLHSLGGFHTSLGELYDSNILDTVFGLWRVVQQACLTLLLGWTLIFQLLPDLTLRKWTYKRTLGLWHMCTAMLLFGVPGISASDCSSKEQADTQDHISDLVTEMITILMRWSGPTLLASGAVFAIHRMTLLDGRRQRSEAVKTARAAAGASCLVAGMLTDPRSTAEWVFPAFSAAMLLQFLFWRALLSDQDKNLKWLALTVAIGASADGLLCHLASSSQGIGYSLFIQLLPLSVWLTLMGMSCFLRQQSYQLRRTSGFILPH